MPSPPSSGIMKSFFGNHHCHSCKVYMHCCLGSPGILMLRGGQHSRELCLRFGLWGPWEVGMLLLAWKLGGTLKDTWGQSSCTHSELWHDAYHEDTAQVPDSPLPHLVLRTFGSRDVQRVQTNVPQSASCESNEREMESNGWSDSQKLCNLRPCLIAQMILPGGCPETELSAAGQDTLKVAESGVAHTLSFSFLFNLPPVAMQG